MSKSKVLIGFGSNLGDRNDALREGLKKLSAHVEIHKISRVYETAPILNADKPFLNAVVLVEFAGEPLDLYRLCKQIEDSMGRIRDIPKGNRVIDIDILVWRAADGGYVEGCYQGINLPHPGFYERDFTLIPASEIAPDWQCTGQSLSLLELVQVKQFEKTILDVPTEIRI